MADLSSMQGVIDQTRRRFGTLHGVIHGAGIVGEKGICEIVKIETFGVRFAFQGGRPIV